MLQPPAPVVLAVGDGLEAGEQLGGCSARRGVGDELDGALPERRPVGIAVDDGDLLRSERTTDTDPLGRLVGDAGDLGHGLLQRLGGIDPEDAAVVATFEGEPGDHAGMG